MSLTPHRSAEQLASGYWKVTVKPTPAHFEASEVILSPDQYKRYEEWLEAKRTGKFLPIQEAFPDLTSAVREQLISGITPDDWNRYLGEI